MSDIKLREASHYILKVSRVAEPNLTWGESPLTVTTDDGLLIYDFTHNAVSHTLGLSLTSHLCPTQKSIPCKKICEKDYSTFLSNQDYIQFRINPYLWARSENFAKDLVHTTMWEWLDCDTVGFPILTTLTNAGSIDFYREDRLCFQHLLNLNDILERKCIEENKLTILNGLQEVAVVCKSIYASAFCWGNKNHSKLHFVSTHRNGDLIIWNMWYLKENKTLIASENFIMEDINEEIIGVKWIYETIDTFLLLCSFAYGRVIGYSFRIEDDCSIVHTNTIKFWDDNDKMVAKYVESYKFNDKNITIYSKHRHLVINVLDFEYNILDTMVTNINDYKIIGLVKSDNNKIVVGTFSCEIFDVKINIVDSKIQMELNKVTIEANLENKFHLNAIGVSKNNVFWALDVSERVMELQRGITKYRINLLYNNINEIDLLLNNPTQSLNNMSDCIELIKFKVGKFKILPDINYDTLLYEGMENIYKLKIYLILVTLYKNRLRFSSNKEKYYLPETSVEKVKDTIFMKHAISILKNLSLIYNDVGMLNQMQIEVYHGCKNNLMEYSRKYEIDIDNLYIDNLVIECNFNYICQCCDEELNGFTCKNNHLNQFCSVTFMPIVADKYLVCKSCSLTGRFDMQADRPKCTLCDLPLVSQHE